MDDGKNFEALSPGHLLLYLIIGILLDVLLALFFTFCDLLDILNASSRSLLKTDVSVILRFAGFYLLIFVPAGVAVTLLICIIYFFQKHRRNLKRFIWTKTEFLLLIWLVLLYPVIFGYYLKKVFHVDLTGHDTAFLAFGIMYLLVFTVSFYKKNKAFKYSLAVFRLFLILAILPAMLYLVFANAGISRGKSSAQSDTFQDVDFRSSKDYNILLITIDTCRADKLSCYGCDKQTSPNIDRLTENGFIFDYAFSASNWTKPAAASLFTSLYPAAHKTNALFERIPSALQCLPEYFQRAGYHTAVFSANANVTPDFGFDQGVDLFYETSRLSMIHFSSLFIRLSRLSPFMEEKLRRFRLLGEGDTEGSKYEAGLYERFSTWLEAIGGEKFFANIHFNAPHASYNPPAEYDIFSDDPTVVVRREEPARRTRLPGKQVQRILSLYYGEIFYVDDLIGRTIRSLKASGIFDRTIIVITADHGEEFFDHQSWGHAHTMFNELLHIPLIIYIPGHPNAPARIRNHVSIVDIGPTLLSLSGLQTGSPKDGKDLSPLFKGASEDVHDFIISESLTSPKDKISKYAVIGKDYKYIEYNYGSKKVGSFFDLQEDFQEKNRMRYYEVPDPQAFKDRLEEMKQKAQSDLSGPEKIRLSRERKKQLEDLGYVQ